MNTPTNKAVPGELPTAELVTLDMPTVFRNQPNLYKPLAMVCERAAKMQKLDVDVLKGKGNYALLGISEDGSVMALNWRGGAWFPLKAPIPSKLARSSELGLVRLDTNTPVKPVWVRVDGLAKEVQIDGKKLEYTKPTRMVILRDGREFELWKAPTAISKKPQPRRQENPIGEPELPRLEDVPVTNPVDWGSMS